MKYEVIHGIVNNTFLPSYYKLKDYLKENNLDNNHLNQNNQIEGGFNLDFCACDTKTAFEKNLKTHPKDWYYRTHPVKYTLNSLGYRTKEFDEIDWKESIVIFGCSFIFGTGVTDEHTVSYFLQELLKRPVINMGIGASSIQTALHNSIILNDSKYPTPKAVIYAWTSLNRFQIYECDSVSNAMEFGNLVEHDHFNNIKNVIPFNLMNIKMIRNLWKNKTIYYEYTNFRQHELINKLDKEIYCDFFPADMNSRELSHPGILSNKKIAENIYEKIKDKI